MQEAAEAGRGHRLTAALAVPYLLAVLPHGVSLSLVMVQRASMGGAAPAPFTPYATDMISGGVIGLTVLAVGGLVAPWLAHACRPYLGVSQPLNNGWSVPRPGCMWFQACVCPLDGSWGATLPQ